VYKKELGDDFLTTDTALAFGASVNTDERDIKDSFGWSCKKSVLISVYLW